MPIPTRATGILSTRQTTAPAQPILRGATDQLTSYINILTASRDNMKLLRTRTEPIELFFRNNGLVLPEVAEVQMFDLKRSAPFNFSLATESPLVVSSGYTGNDGKQEFYHLNLNYVDKPSPTECKITYELIRTDERRKKLRSIFELAINPGTKGHFFKVSGTHVRDTAYADEQNLVHKIDPKDVTHVTESSYGNDRETLRALFEFIATQPWLYVKMREVGGLGSIPALGPNGLPEGMALSKKTSVASVHGQPTATAAPAAPAV